MKTSFKRAFGLILVLTLVCTLLFAFTACDNSDEMSALEKKVQELQNKVAGFEESTAEKAITVNIGENSYTLTTRENRMVYALSELVEKGSIATFTYAKGSYGAFITALDTPRPDTSILRFIIPLITKHINRRQARGTRITPYSLLRVATIPRW